MAHDDAPICRATVSRVRRLTPNMQRITLTGVGFESSGSPDERLLVTFPSDPTHQRSYTVRRWDPAAREIDIDFVIHRGGLASAWAEGAALGDVITLSTPSGWYSPPADAQWQWLIADMTALPAVGRIVEGLPAGAAVHVIAEVCGPEDEQHFSSPGTLTYIWLHGSGNGASPSGLATAASNLTFPDGPGYIWFAGEAGTSRDIRRWVRHELGWSVDRYDVIGYWRDRKEQWTERYAMVADQIEAARDDALAAGMTFDEIRDAVDEAMKQAGL